MDGALFDHKQLRRRDYSITSFTFRTISGDAAYILPTIASASMPRSNSIGSDCRCASARKFASLSVSSKAERRACARPFIVAKEVSNDRVQVLRSAFDETAPAY